MSAASAEWPKTISRSTTTKKDRRDAFTLARLFRLNESKPARQEPTDGRALFKSAAQSYEEAVLRQTQLKQQIKSTLSTLGLFPHGHAAQFRGGPRRVVEAVAPRRFARASGTALRVDGAGVQTQRATRKLMVRLGKAFPEVKLLSSDGQAGAGGAEFIGPVKGGVRSAE